MYDLALVTDVAKEYGMSAKRFNQLLNKYGIQYYYGGRWQLYANYQGCGYVVSRTREYSWPDGTRKERTQMYWTGKGRQFLREFLEGKGILPVEMAKQNF